MKPWMLDLLDEVMKVTKVEGGRASAGSHLLQNTYVKQGLFIVHCCACIAAFPGPRQLQLYRPAGQTPLSCNVDRHSSLAHDPVWGSANELHAQSSESLRTKVVAPVRDGSAGRRAPHP